MAEIFLGRMVGPSGFERPVVIKRILPHLARLTEFVDMFLDEARIVANIRHPNVVHVEELGRDRGELFLVMEYLEGESASGLMRRMIAVHKKLAYVVAAHIVAEACAGLHAAHELTDNDGVTQNLVHRDVSPQNILVTYSGEVKVLDFGIAKAADRVTRTEAGQVKGKLEYMSPEQCKGKPLERTSDIFALGTLLYELSTGHRLFKRPSQLDVLRAICEEPLVPPSSVEPDYPTALANICTRALAKAPEDRYATAAEMRRDIVLAIRTLAGDIVPEEALASLMREIFHDRIEAKSDMLRRVRSGSSLTSVPAAETDDSVEVPGLSNLDATEAGTSQVANTPKAPSRPTTAIFAALTVLVVGVLSFGVYWAVERRPPVADPVTASTMAGSPIITATAAPSPPVTTHAVVDMDASPAASATPPRATNTTRPGPRATPSATPRPSAPAPSGSGFYLLP